MLHVIYGSGFMAVKTGKTEFYKNVIDLKLETPVVVVDLSGPHIYLL